MRLLILMDKLYLLYVESYIYIYINCILKSNDTYLILFRQNMIEKKNSIIYIHPNYFFTYGYATFLNYMSICDNIIKQVPYNLSITKSADVCSHLDCDYFTKSNYKQNNTQMHLYIKLNVVNKYIYIYIFFIVYRLSRINQILRQHKEWEIMV